MPRRVGMDINPTNTGKISGVFIFCLEGSVIPLRKHSAAPECLTNVVEYRATRRATLTQPRSLLHVMREVKGRFTFHGQRLVSDYGRHVHDLTSDFRSVTVCNTEITTMLAGTCKLSYLQRTVIGVAIVQPSHCRPTTPTVNFQVYSTAK